MKPFALSNILAATDLTDSSLPALRYAHFLADRVSAKLTVMYVEPIVYPADYMGPTEPSGSTAHPSIARNSMRKSSVMQLRR